MARARLIEPQPVEKEVELVLTRHEAKYLCWLLGQLAGLPDGPSKEFDSMYESLNELIGRP